MHISIDENETPRSFAVKVALWIVPLMAGYGMVWLFTFFEGPPSSKGEELLVFFGTYVLAFLGLLLIFPKLIALFSHKPRP